MTARTLAPPRSTSSVARSIRNQIQPDVSRCLTIVTTAMPQVGRGKQSDSADYTVASLHELPSAVPELFAMRPPATPDGASAAAAAGAERNGAVTLTPGASLDETDLSIQVRDLETLKP